MIAALVVAISAARASECGAQAATAFTEPSQTVEVAAGEPGILAEMLVEPGDRVAAGQTLARLDDTMAHADVTSARVRAEAQGGIDAARARLNQAQSRLNEIDKLRNTGALRPLELLGAESDLEVAKAQLQQALDERRAAQAALAGAEARLARLSIAAPFDGAVDHVFRQPGELVGASGDARLVTLIRLDRLDADFFVPADCIAGVRVGDEIQVQVVREGRELGGKVRDIGRLIDAPTGLQLISLELPNLDYGVLGGERIVLQLPLLPEEP